jgi:hypothetical protein
MGSATVIEAGRIIRSILLDLTNAHCLKAKRTHGELAQLGERLVCNQEVTGSSPVFSTIFRRTVSRQWRHQSSDEILGG